MSKVLDGVKKHTRDAVAKRLRGLQGKTIRDADQAILDGLTILARHALCAFPERGDHELIQLTTEHAELIGLLAKGDDDDA